VEKDSLKELFRDAFGNEARTITELPGAGSHRRYFRMEGGGKGCIAVFSPDPLETEAFIAFTRHFGSLRLNVPGLIAENLSGGIYLLQDLGNLTLKDEIDGSRLDGTYPDRIMPLYRSALEHLLSFQVDGHKGMDYSVCVPRSEFDRQSILWDLNHFKYFFLKLTGIPFDEQKLENDFQAFAGFLSGADTGYFMYRDFQSRNIMIHNKDLYFLDYQGGRRGALQYDVASLLFEARVDLSPDIREELLEFYIERLEKMTGIPTAEFRKYYYGFVLIRILQAMGAYGIRGIVENKALFLQSIPFAIRNIEWLIGQSRIPDGLMELTACLERLGGLEKWKTIEDSTELRVHIHSFSYKKGLPADLSGNGGGYIFDCRALPNPGREQKYRHLTGLDADVIKYLQEKKQVGDFLERTFSLVEQSVEEYRSLNYNRLMVSYGCTGGQHRSVYCAERLQEFIEKRLNVKTKLVHRELDNV
jgi:aminoglycoside/choline kinase family phosphotransferase